MVWGMIHEVVYLLFYLEKLTYFTKQNKSNRCLDLDDI